LFKSNFVQNLKKIQNKNLFNPKSEQISKYKIVQILEKKTEKTEKKHHMGRPNKNIGGPN
jgi:hypothetical protein